ncbi:MAG: YbgC/FadM family acyl-CoA thioesterase [Candidatus Puniceispirillaceae bacterium]
MSDFKTNLNDNRLAEEAALGLDGVIDETNPKHSKHLYGLVVQYEDIDAGGIVYHSTYLNFAERARSALLRASKFDVQYWLAEENQGFVITHIETDYLSPAKLHNRLIVETSCLQLGGASALLQQNINSFDRGHIFARVMVKAAWVDIELGPRKFPEPLQMVLRSYQPK